MNPLLGNQLERQIILLDEQQLQGPKHKLPTKETAATNNKSPGVSAQTESSDSILKVDKRGKRAERLNDGLALRMAHPELIHPTPVTATKYSPILEAIDKLEILAQTMNLTSEATIQPEEELKYVFPTPNCHEPQETLQSPSFKPLLPSTAPSILTLGEPEGAHQQHGLTAIRSNTPSEPAATVVAYPSKTTASPHPCSPPISSTLSTIASLFPRSATSSTRSHSSLLETYTNTPAISSRLQTSFFAGTRENITIGREGNAMCEKLDNEHTPNLTADNRHQKKQRVHMTGSGVRNLVESVGFKANPTAFPVVHSPSLPPLTSKPSPHSAASRPPMAPRALPFFKKRSSPYTHQSMAQSDSQIDHHGSYSTTATSNINKRQSGSVLASISSTVLGIRSSSRFRSYSNASSFSLTTTQSSPTLLNSTTTKQHSQASHIACVHPPPLLTNLVTNSSAKSPNARPFPHFFNPGRQYPMSTLSHSQSTPALLSDGQPNDCKEPFVLCQTGCTCDNKQLSGSCLFHKMLPSLPAAQLNGETSAGLIKEKKRSNRISGMSTVASIRSFVASIKKSRSRTDSVQSLAKLNAPLSRESQQQSQSDTSLPSMHPQVPVLNHGLPLTTTRRRNRKEPASIVRCAVKRHTAADVPLPASPALSECNLGFQQAKRQAVYGLKRRPLSLSHHDSEQRRACTGQLYLYPMSPSTPCLVQPVPSTKAITSNKHLAQSMPTIARIRQASKSTPNLSLHGGAQVSVVNAHAEIVVRPHVAGASANSSQGDVNLITSFNADFPSIGRSRPLVPAPSPVHSTGPYSKENATFFEPFQAHSKKHGGKSSSYVSFHFDLSHLEKAEHEDKDGLASITKTNVCLEEQDNVGESDGGEDEDGMDDLRCVSSSPPAHLSTSLPNVTFSFRDLLPAHLRNRATLLPPPPPPRSRPQGVDQENSSSDEDDNPFQTLHQHLKTATSASASSSSLLRPSQPQSAQHHPLKRLLGYDKDKPEHRSYSESLPRAQEATNSSTVSLPAMLSSFLPSSVSTASLPLHSKQTHLGTGARLAGRGSKSSGSKWNWMWWKNGNKSSNIGNSVPGQEVGRK